MPSSSFYSSSPQALHHNPPVWFLISTCFWSKNSSVLVFFHWQHWQVFSVSNVSWTTVSFLCKKLNCWHLAVCADVKDLNLFLLHLRRKCQKNSKTIKTESTSSTSIMNLENIWILFYKYYIWFYLPLMLLTTCFYIICSKGTRKHC